MSNFVYALDSFYGAYTGIGSVPQEFQPNPLAYYQGNINNYWSGFNEKDCQARQDFLVQILPGSCSPAVVRSDLLEENNVPVFCRLTGVKINPLINVPEITSITFKPQNRTLTKDIVNIGFHPARAAIKTWGSKLIGSPVLDNLGYLVVILRSQPSEKNMSKWVEADLTAKITYNAENAFGIGKANFIIPEISKDEEWQQFYQEYGFWKGKGYVRVLEIGKESSNTDYARIGIYTDANRMLTSLTLKRGETSSEIYLPGYYCQAGFKVNLLDINQPKDKAKIIFDDDEMWVSQGQRINDKCSVSEVKPDLFGGGRVKINCGMKSYILEKKPPKAKISVKNDGKEEVSSKEFGVGESIVDEERIMLAYIGNTRKALDSGLRQQNKDFVVIIKIDTSESVTANSIIEQVGARTKQLLEGKTFAGAGIFGLTSKEPISSLSKLEEKLNSYFKGRKVYVAVAEIASSASNANFGKREFYFENLAGVYEESYTSYDEGKLLEEYYNKAEEAFKDIATNHGAEKEWQKEGIQNGEYYGAKALYEAATLAGKLRKFKTQKELLEKIKETYPDSLLALKASQELEEIGVNEISGSSTVVYVDGETHFVSLVDLQSAATGKTTKISYSVTKSGQTTTGEGDYSEKDSLPDGVVVERIDDDKVYFKYPSKGFWGESTINIEEGKDSVIYLAGDESVRIFVKSIEMTKEANLQIIPRVERAETEANFTFKIAIEKRAIKLSPEKTKEVINELNKTIAQWESITNSLKKIVEGWKGTCLAGSTFLMAKSFFKNLNGGSVGRQMAMQDWKEICREEVAEAKRKGEDMTESKCFMKHNDAINTWTNFYATKAKEINGISKECKDKEGVVQTSKYMGIFEQSSMNEQKFIDNCKKYIVDSAKDANFNKQRAISIKGEVLGDEAGRQDYQRIYGDKKFIDPKDPNKIISWEELIEKNPQGGEFILQESDQLKGSNVFSEKKISLLQERGYLSSEDFKDIMMSLETQKACQNAKTQDDINYCKSVERNLYDKIDYFSKRGGAEEQRKSYKDLLLKLKTPFNDVGEVPEIKDTLLGRVSDVRKPSEDEKNTLKDVFIWDTDYYYIAPFPYHLVSKQDYKGITGTKLLLLKLNHIREASDGTDRYSIEEAALATEKGYEKLGEAELSQLKSTVREISYLSPSKYRNEYKNPEVRYWETGAYKGFPALVPLGKYAKEGWYAATQPYVIGTKSFTEAGQLWNFWICNVGANGIEQFRSPSHGDDMPCQGFVLNTGQPTDRLAGLDEKKAADLIKAAQEAIRDAQNQYGKKKVLIGGKEFTVGRPEVETSQMQCEDFMSPSDCNWLFNLCDPVLCPPSRCDFGGRYPVADVVQTGIVGSILLCLPNGGPPSEGGVLVPVCLTGIHAGLDMYTKTLKMARDCLQENLKSGKTVGICDQMTSIYKCEFFWKQAVPLIKIGIPYMLETVRGEKTRGGGEYMFVQNAWTNLDKSVDYFTNYYGLNAFKAFQAKSVEQAGTEICKMYVSANYPTSADFFKKLVEPESPTQFHVEFSEDVMTEATVPPTSHYKVSYRIYAGNDQGIYYQIYLKGAPTTEYYQVMQTLNVPNAMGYLAVGEYTSESIDFTAPTGYKELCIQINGQEKCGFGQVTTSFMFDEIKNLYLKDEATAAVATEDECISGKPSLMPIALGTNPEAAIQESIEPSIYKRGIIRICATDDPGLQTELGRWRNIGYCGDAKIRCWLDTFSLNKTISDLGLLEETLDEAKAREKEINQEKFMTDTECSDKLINAVKLKDKKVEDIDKFLRDAVDKNGKLSMSLTNFENGIDTTIEEVIAQFQKIIRDCGYSEYIVKARFAVADIYKLITEKIYVMSEKSKKGSEETKKAAEEQTLKQGITPDKTINGIIFGKKDGELYVFDNNNWRLAIQEEIDIYTSGGKKEEIEIPEKEEIDLDNNNEVELRVGKESKDLVLSGGYDVFVISTTSYKAIEGTEREGLISFSETMYIQGKSIGKFTGYRRFSEVDKIEPIDSKVIDLNNDGVKDVVITLKGLGITLEDVGEKSKNIIESGEMLWKFERYEKLEAKKKIVIDPGHGGKDSNDDNNDAFYGARGPSGSYEKDLMLSIAKKLKEKLENAGFEAILTRETDSRNLLLTDRIEKANDAEADLFISLHANSMRICLPILGAEGTETYVFCECSKGVLANGKVDKCEVEKCYSKNEFTEESKLFAYSIQKKITNAIGTKDKGAKGADFTVLQSAKMPAVLVETAYICNKNEEEILKSEEGQEKIAEAISKAIKEFS